MGIVGVLQNKLGGIQYPSFLPLVAAMFECKQCGDQPHAAATAPTARVWFVRHKNVRVRLTIPGVAPGVPFEQTLYKTHTRVSNVDPLRDLIQ